MYLTPTLLANANGRVEQGGPLEQGGPHLHCISFYNNMNNSL